MHASTLSYRGVEIACPTCPPGSHFHQDKLITSILIIVLDKYRDGSINSDLPKLFRYRIKNVTGNEP